MGFLEAVKSGFARYFDFSTRSSRSEYWFWILFLVIFGVLISIVEGAMGLQPESLTERGPIERVFSFATLIPGIAVSVRRLHDIDKSGWFFLLWFLPIIGWAVLIFWHCMRGTDGANRFGDDPLNPTGDMGEVFE